MPGEDLRFLEIEHKFLVGPDFDPQPLLALLRQQLPTQQYATEVRDTYFLVARLPQVVYRHRLDSFLQQLTLKSLAGDNETRTEINIDLGLQVGDQSAAVRAFLEPQGLLWSGSLTKNVQVFYFDDAEVVFYKARFGDSEQACIEIEARNHQTIEEGRRILGDWELRLGLAAGDRCKASLLELLILPHLPADLRLTLQNLLGP